MALTYVDLTVDLYDGQGRLLTAGMAVFTPSVQLTDPGDHEVVTPAPVRAVFTVTGPPVVRLLATDNTGMLPSGWAWTVTFTGVPGSPAGFSFFLPYANGATQYLSALTPVAGMLPVTLTSLDGGSAATGNFPIGALDGGHA